MFFFNLSVSFLRANGFDFSQVIDSVESIHRVLKGIKIRRIDSWTSIPCEGIQTCRVICCVWEKVKLSSLVIREEPKAQFVILAPGGNLISAAWLRLPSQHWFKFVHIDAFPVCSGGGYRTLLLSPAAHAENPSLRSREHQTGELSFSDPDLDWIHYPDGSESPKMDMVQCTAK
jgi:hypothetical protein